MNFILSVAAVAALVPGIYGLTINTPAASTLVVCEPISLTWTDGTAPYYLSIIPGGDTSSVLISFDSTTDTSITWTVDIAAGTSISLALKDSTGTIAYSDAVTIQSGSDTSCVSSSTSASEDSGSDSSATDATATATGTTTATGVTTSATGAATSTTKTTGTTATTATTAKTSATVSTVSASSSGGASSTMAMNYGLVGFLALLGFTLL